MLTSSLALSWLVLLAVQAPVDAPFADDDAAGVRTHRPSVALRLDVRADERYAICVRLLRQGQDAEARACLERLVEEAPDTTAALRASSVLSAVPPRAAMSEEVLPRRPLPFDPGHLELALTSGLFGAYNGAVGALWLSLNPDLTPPYVSALGGVGAALLGGGYTLGTWLLADGLDLSQGDSHLLASGIGWGTALGLTLAPWMFSLAGVPWPEGVMPPFRHDLSTALPLGLLPSVVGGYVGLGGAAVLAALLELEASQVATLNTGGGTGFLLGLGAGLGVAHLLRLDVWEVLLIDLATVAAFALVGGGAYLLRSAGPPSPELDVVAGGATALGTVVGLGASTAAVSFFRVRRGESASRAGVLPLDVLFAPPTAVLDRDQQLVPMFSLVALRF